MLDRFEDVNHPSSFWESIDGGGLGTGCGAIGTGNSMYFDGIGTREARTVAMDTRYIRYDTWEDCIVYDVIIFVYN